MVHHEGAERIVVEDWHAFSVEDFLELGGDNLIWTELNYFTIQCLEVNHADGEGVSEGDFVAVHKVISHAADRLMLLLLDCHDQVSGEAVVWGVTFTSESENGTGFHARLHLDLFLDRDFMLSGSIALRLNLPEIETLS